MCFLLGIILDCVLNLIGFNLIWVFYWNLVDLVNFGGFLVLEYLWVFLDFWYSWVSWVSGTVFRGFSVFWVFWVLTFGFYVLCFAFFEFLVCGFRFTLEVFGVGIRQNSYRFEWFWDFVYLILRVVVWVCGRVLSLCLVFRFGFWRWDGFVCCLALCLFMLLEDCYFCNVLVW